MTWDDLRQLRAQGLRPSLPVVISTDMQRPAYLLRDEGCLVIHHKSGELFPVELLDGLCVWLFIGGCDRSQTIVSMMVAKGVKPQELGAWCECMGRMDYQPVSCEVAKQWH